MEFISEWLIKGIGFGIGTIGWAFTIVATTGLFTAIVGIIGGIAEAIKRKDKEK